MNTKNITILLGGGVTVFVLGAMVWSLGTFPKNTISYGAQQMEDAAEMQKGDMGIPAGMDQATVMISPARRQLIGVKTEAVKEEPLETVIRTVGTVDYDERRVRQVNLRVSGWITDLHVDYTGQPVKKGDPLLTLYSPDLISTQEEYLLAKETLDRVQASPLEHIRRGAEIQVEASRNRLLLWDLTERQIAQMDQDQPWLRETTIYSPIQGVVTQKMALPGMYVTPEMALYQMADLSAVWLYAEIYEYELSLVKVGQQAAVRLTSYPGEIFEGRVVYIYPYLNNESRTVKLRMEFQNIHGRLKPGMYGNVEIRVKLGTRLAVPQDAVLDSGIRKLVFVDQGGGMYEPREVTLGHKVNRFYPVLSGLTPGEIVVTSGTFLIDSESKLMAATNMMGLLGMGGIRMEKAQMGEMEMGGMEMGQKETAMPTSLKELVVDGLTIILSTQPEPPKKGENRIRVTLQSQGTPVIDAIVTLEYTMAMPGMDIETVEAEHTGNGLYEADADFGMKGTWEVEVTVSRGSSRPVKTKFTVSVGK